MQVAMICSECKRSVGLLQSVETQTVELDWVGELNTDNLQPDRRIESEQDCGEEETSRKSDIVHIEDIEFIEACRPEYPQGNAAVPHCAVYRDVSDEAFEMDRDMELGTFAEMCHENDKIVALTRSFECPSQAKDRWQKATSVGKAANRFGRLKKGKSPGISEGDGILSDSQVYTGGCRRIVISSGKLAINQLDVKGVENEGTLNGAKEEGHENLEGNVQLSSILKERGVEEIESCGSKSEEETIVDSDRHISNNMLKRVSHVLGPNKRCLHLDEQQEQIDPEEYIDLSDTDKTTYNVVVVTRSFECGALSDTEKQAGARWNRVKNATKFSKALSRLRQSNERREGDHDQMLSEDDENNCAPFVGSGYRRMSMKTIEEVASLAKKRNRFWKSHR